MYCTTDSGLILDSGLFAFCGGPGLVSWLAVVNKEYFSKVITAMAISEIRSRRALLFIASPFANRVWLTMNSGFAR